MQKCPRCDGRMGRAHRTALEKLVYSGVFSCDKCKARVGWYHPVVLTQLVRLRFVFSLRTRCLKCGKTERVSRLAKRDYIDGVSKSPLSWLQRLMGAPINRCSACRLQYYDWRRPSPEAKSE